MSQYIFGVEQRIRLGPVHIGLQNLSKHQQCLIAEKGIFLDNMDKDLHRNAEQNTICGSHHKGSVGVDVVQVFDHA